jgi:hypothetical protein
MTKWVRWTLAFWLASNLAWAQGPSDPSALARELFSQGRALMDAGEHEAACAKFEESQRLEPGGGTLLNLALCNEKLGKTATAWALFNQAIVVARRDGRADRETFAKEHVDAIAPKLSRLTVQVPSDARTPGLRIELNGTEIGKGAWGGPLPVDPGTQEIVVTAPGKIKLTITISVGDAADKKEISVGPLRDAPKPPPRPVSPVRDRGPQKQAESEMPIWPFWTFTGLAAATAGVLTVNAYSSHKSAEDERERFGTTSGEYESARDKARRNALFADIAWGVTAVSAGVSLYVTLKGSGSSQENVRVGMGPGSLRLDGRF